MNDRMAHRLYVFHRRCLRTILGSRISWRDHATNEEVIRRADMKRLQAIVVTRRGQMDGHILRVQSLRERPTHAAEEMGGGERRRHDDVLSNLGFSWHGARRVVSDRERWRLREEQAGLISHSLARSLAHSPAHHPPTNHPPTHPLTHSPTHHTHSLIHSSGDFLGLPTLLHSFLSLGMVIVSL